MDLHTHDQRPHFGARGPSDRCLINNAFNYAYLYLLLHMEPVDLFRVGVVDVLPRQNLGHHRHKVRAQRTIHHVRHYPLLATLYEDEAQGVDFPTVPSIDAHHDAAANVLFELLAG